MNEASEPNGLLSLVLHAHLPFIRHPEHRSHLEENWLHEAVTATYLPLLEVFRGLQRDGAKFRVTLSMSPPLVSMLRDDLLRLRTAAYLDRLLSLAEKERQRLQYDDTFRPLAEFYSERFHRLKHLYDAIHGDIVGAFAQLQDDGYLEIITVGATHGFLPAMREPAARRVQIQLAAEHYQQHFGRWPRGIWLAECGYTGGIDEILADAGFRFFFTDSHGLLHADPRPPFANFGPIYTRSGVAAFARDMESSTQVWSASEGYPGDPAYRDFYRDVGFDAPLEHVRPYVHPDGIRIHTGFKYFRVTGKVDLAHKAPYEPNVARERAAQHAGNFLFNRQLQTRHLAEYMDRPPLVVSPYDAELYGHWWFEGPQFLDFLFRKMHFDQSELRAVTPSDYLEMFPANPIAAPSPSSWGEGGYSGVWVDGSNDWIYRHQHRAEARMVELAQRYGDSANNLERRALNQAARELLLLQSSDWAFILKNQTASGYAISRVKAHVARFRRIDREVSEGHIDEGWLANLERRDNIFPDLDFRIYR